jgi:hypothetical protein
MNIKQVLYLLFIALVHVCLFRVDVYQIILSLTRGIVYIDLDVSIIFKHTC